MERDIVCVCEVAQDIDDLIALDFLKRSNRLKGVVLDPPPKTREDWIRVKKIKSLGIEIYKSIPYCKAIFVGGAFTSVARYLSMNKVEYIIANGGFVGANIVPENKQLKKFKGKTHVRTFNFCLDVDSALMWNIFYWLEKMYAMMKKILYQEYGKMKTGFENIKYLRQNVFTMSWLMRKGLTT